MRKNREKRRAADCYGKEATEVCGATFLFDYLMLETLYAINYSLFGASSHLIFNSMFNHHLQHLIRWKIVRHSTNIRYFDVVDIWLSRRTNSHYRFHITHDFTIFSILILKNRERYARQSIRHSKLRRCRYSIRFFAPFHTRFDVSDT